MYHNSVLPSQTQTQEHTYTDLVESEDTSSHTYTNPAKKRSVRKPVTPRPAHRTTTDGDSGTGTMSPDQNLPEESDCIRTLPPHSYVNYEFDILHQQCIYIQVPVLTSWPAQSQHVSAPPVSFYQDQVQEVQL